MLKYLGILSLVLLFFISCQSTRQEALIPIENFFSTPEKSHFQVAPNGKYIAYLEKSERGQNIFLKDLSNEKLSKQLTTFEDQKVSSFYWGSNEELIFSIDDIQTHTVQLYVVDVKTASVRNILPTTKGKMRWISPSKINDRSIIVALNERDSTFFDVYKISLTGKPKEMIIRNPGNMIQWYTAGSGDIHLAWTSDSIEESLLYRPHVNAPFKEVERNDFTESIVPLGYVKSSTTLIYALSNINRDKYALVEYNVAEGKEVRKLYEHPQVDLEASGYSVQLQEMLYSAYITDKEEKIFFNAKVEKLYAAIADELEGFQFKVIDRDSALTKIVIRTYTDVNPGAIYYYDVADKELHKLADNYPKLQNYKLATMEPIAYQSRDGQTIHGYLTFPVSGARKNLPVIVMPHDGPHRRDVWGFQPNVQFLANRGYAVFQMNYRGSVGYGKMFWSAGFKQWGGKIQEDILDGVDWLVASGVADKHKIGIFGEGFGGYAALFAACFQSSKFKCAASISGYTNLFTYFRDVPPFFKPYLQKFYQVIGNPTTESDLFKAISPVFHADKVSIPVFLVQGGKDRYNSVTDANLFVQKIQQNKVPVTYLLMDDEGKRFKNDAHIIQSYQELENFLKVNLGNK